MLSTFRFSLNASIINHCFSCVLFEEYYCTKDDLCEIYALQDKKLVMDLFLAKFHDTIFIEVDADLTILVHMAIFLGFFSV